LAGEQVDDGFYHALFSPSADTDRISVKLATGCERIWLFFDEDTTGAELAKTLLGAGMTPDKGLPLRLDLSDPARLRDAPDPLSAQPGTEF
jgi:hypothetical protein